MRRQAAWLVLGVSAALVAIYATAFVVSGGLSREPRKDEVFFWPIVVEFSGRLIPSVEQMRDYPAPGTPLPFIVWGALEHLFHGGIVTGRVLNAIVSLGAAALVAWPRAGSRRRLLAGAGLLACPYFVGTGVMLYTDTLAVACVMAGVWGYLRDRAVVMGVAFALAIACRQYAVAFPLAVAANEAWRWLGGERRRWGVVVAAVIAAATLGAWVALFGGLAPRSAVEFYGLGTASPAALVPRNGLYFVACVGAYFVVPEAVLFRRMELAREVWSRRTLVGAVVLGGWFFAFPPLGNEDYAIPTMGLLDRAARVVLPDWARMVAFWGLGVLAVARLGRANLAGWIVLANAAVLMKAHIGWDKYALPALAALWLITSRDEGGGATPRS